MESTQHSAIKRTIGIEPLWEEDFKIKYEYPPVEPVYVPKKSGRKTETVICNESEFMFQSEIKIEHPVMTDGVMSPIGTFECYICKYKGSSKFLMEMHLKMHNRHEQLDCDSHSNEIVETLTSICSPSVSCADKNAITSENDCRFRTKRMYECYLCSRKYKLKQDFVRHMRIHSGKVLQCRVSMEKLNLEKYLLEPFPRKFLIETHSKMQNLHKQLDCDSHSNEIVETLTSGYCSPSVSCVDKNSGTLKNDCRLLTPSRYECYLCSRKYKLKQDLVRHMHSYMHSGKVRQCRVSIEKLNLEKYLLEPFPIPTKKRFKCAECSTVAVSQGTLIKHIRTHIGDKENQCVVCLRKFSYGRSLLRHKEKCHMERKVHKCKICSKTFKYTSSFIGHKRWHKAKIPVECDICYKRFTFKAHLKIHKRLHLLHDCDATFVCNKCPKKFFTESMLKLHVNSHSLRSGDYSRPFECYLCQRKYVFKHSLARHLRVHTGEFQCKVCKKVFLRKSERDEHIQIHSGKYKYECSECSKGFDVVANLQRHMRNHTGEKLFNCSACPRQFKEKDYLTAHIRIVHGDEVADCVQYSWKYSNEDKFNRKMETNVHFKTGRKIQKDFKCKVCFSIFKQERDFITHYRTHSGKTLFECSECKRGFDYRPNLYRHMKIHSDDEPYHCDQCPKKFKYQNSLNIHIRCHNGVKVECNICFKKFSDKSYLKIHNRFHTGETPFACSFCPRKFKAKQSQQLHELTHRKGKVTEQRFECNVCSNKFISRRGLLRHKRENCNQKIFECEPCGKTFKTKTLLIEHMHSHIGKSKRSKLKK